MGTRTRVGITAGAVGLTIVAALGSASRPAGSTAARHIVVAELFTSEGCSSCPPADDLLRNIVAASPVDRVEVLGLEEHVDYWDRLGWRDPFSSAALTSRQSEYAARVFRSEQIYTPQLVVDGSFEAVGSDRARVRAAIVAAAARPAASVLVTAMRVGDRARVDVSVAMPPAVERRGRANIMLAIVEDELVSQVERGENRGRTLVHSGVVRSLDVIGAWPSDASAHTLSVDVPLATAWKAAHLRAIGFVQERDSLRILGAGAAPLSAQTVSSDGRRLAEATNWRVFASHW